MEELEKKIDDELGKMLSLLIPAIITSPDKYKAFLKIHRNQLLELFREEKNKLYLDIYKLKGKTINGQSGFMHKHIILDKLNHTDRKDKGGK